MPIHTPTLVRRTPMIVEEYRLTQTRWGPNDEFKVFTALHPSMNHINGYVCVPKAHPWHGVQYSKCTNRDHPCQDDYCDHTPERLLSVHGGITYAGADEDDWWCFGWDTAHPHSNSWSEADVLMESYLLAAQLLAVWNDAR